MILFIFIASSAFIIAVIRQIWIAQSWVWQTWVWIRVLWYVVFLLFLFPFWIDRRCCFCVWLFCTNESWIKRWSIHFNIFVLKLKFGILQSNFIISFIVFFTIVWFFAHSVSKRCPFDYSIIFRTSMGGIQQPSDYDIGNSDLGAFIAMMAESTWFMNIGSTRLTDSVAMFTLQHIWRSLLEPLESFSPNTWALTDVAIGSLKKILSKPAFNSSGSLNIWGVDCRILTILGIQRLPEGGAALVPIISLIDEIEIPLSLMGTGVVLPTPFLIICCGFLFVSVLFEAAPTTIYCTVGDLSTCGPWTTPLFMNKYSWFFAPILGSIRGVKTDTSSCRIPIIQVPNKFW